MYCNADPWTWKKGLVRKDKPAELELWLPKDDTVDVVGAVHSLDYSLGEMVENICMLNININSKMSKIMHFGRKHGFKKQGSQTQKYFLHLC